MNVKRILSRLRLDKVAAVDRPCQEHATVALIKRLNVEGDTPGAKLAKSLYETLIKSGIPLDDPDGDEGAQAFDEVLSEQQLTSEFWDAWYKATSALQESLCSIIKDDSAGDKPTLIQHSLKQFADHIEQILPGDVGKSLAAGIAASVGQPGTTTGEVMTPELKKALGLPETASDADMLKAIQDKDAAIAKANEELEKAKKVPAGQQADGGKDDPDADDMAKALASGDAFRTPEGTVITKKAVGDGIYAVLKSQNDQIAKQAAEIAKAREAEEERSFAKRADDLGYGVEFGPTLRKAYSGDATAQGELEKRIQGLQKQVEEGSFYKSFGHNQPAADSAEAEFMAKVDEVKKSNPTLTEAQAYTKAYTDRSNAPIVKRMRAEARA